MSRSRIKLTVGAFIGWYLGPIVAIREGDNAIIPVVGMIVQDYDR